MKKLLRAAIYIRVSTAEQRIHGKSLQAQRECLERYADDNSMTVIGVYADEGKTARKELKKRKAIHDLVNDVKLNKLDVILFWKMDRWFRNVSDFYKVQDVLDEHSVNWVAVAEPNINMKTREGRLNLNLVLSIGQNEVDTTSERIKFTNESMVSNGKLIFGNANMPLGYKVGYANGEKRMVKNEEESPIVKEFFDYFMKFQNKRATMKHIQDTFDIPFSYSRLRTMLSSEFYIGKYKDNANYCPAYLTKAQWDKIREISTKNIRTIKRSDRVYYFVGMMRCPYCGNLLCGTGGRSVINRTTGEKRTYTYYRCYRGKAEGLCQNKHLISQMVAEEYLIDHLESEYQKYKINCGKIEEKRKNASAKKNPSNIRKEMDNLNLLFQKERIEWNYYDKEYKRLEYELNDVLKHEDVITKDFSHIEELLQGNIKEHYYALDQEHKQAFWRGIINRIYLDTEYRIKSVEFF